MAETDAHIGTVDESVFLWPACLLATNREARKAWKKIEKIAVKHGRWDEALAGIEMISALEHAEEIFIRTPDSRAVAWQLCAISCPDGKGACRLNHIEPHLSRRLLASGLDYLWFALGQFEEPWWRHEDVAELIPLAAPKLANWVVPSRVFSDRLVDIAVDRPPFPPFREHTPHAVCSLLRQLCYMTFPRPGDDPGNPEDQWSYVGHLIAVGVLQLVDGRYVAGPRVVKEA